MALFKCKMCGGDLDITPGVTVAECEYCGTQQTLPKANEEVVQNLFNRANALRLKCEFDKAEQIYEKILHEDDTEAEAHWGIVLCKYGIEYVEDPKTYKRIPTCHRTSYDAVTTDVDYLAAIEHADIAQRSIYEAEAKAIDEIQRGILSIVKNEKPFDVFICYKETDEYGKRTMDSAIANDIYYQLTQEGLKVFYAAITLEDKLGQAYEPYIFAALNSAKVMLVIGTKPQYFTAVWVKNEWSRFMKLMKTDRSKLLIPCYRDMNAYELPEEFAHLQAQDMAKIGFINDVVRGIKKITVKDEPKPTVIKETVVTGGNANTAPLLKRAFMFLEDGDWNSANEYCEKVLDIDPECAEAYLGKLMAELHVRKQEGLKNCAEPFDGKGNYQKALRFADSKLQAALQECIVYINTRNENTRLDGIYNTATKQMKAAKTSENYLFAAAQFDSISVYRDAADLAKKCREEAAVAKERSEISRKDTLLAESKKLMNGSIQDLKNAITKLQSISGWKDADSCAETCRTRLRQKEEAAEISRKDRVLADGKRLMNGSVQDLKNAITKFQSISGWKDADTCAETCRQRILAQESAERKKAAAAKVIAGAVVLAIIAAIVGGIAYVAKWFTVIKPQQELDTYIAEYGQGSYNRFGILEKGQTIIYGSYEQDGDASNGNEEIEWIILDMEDGKALVVSKYALACKRFHDNRESVNWETCSLRAWMNGEFYETAFSDAERNTISKTETGASVQDHVFALSYDEVKQYCKSNAKCEPTKSIVDQVDTIGGDTCAWWLRSYGYGGPQVVSWDGSTVGFGWSETENDVGARPAMWIDLSLIQ